jgi:hypothetical protein
MRTGQHPTICEPGFRQCYRCQTIKPLEEFARHRSKPGGYGYCCKGCNLTCQHKWRTDFPEKKKASDKKYQYKNKDKRRTYAREYGREWRKKNPLSHLKMYRGFTKADYVKLHEQQEGRCALCRTDKPTGRGKMLHVDHCHSTERIRGLVCQRCNSALGFLEYLQQNDLLESAINYLRSTEG